MEAGMVVEIFKNNCCNILSTWSNWKFSPARFRLARHGLPDKPFLAKILARHALLPGMVFKKYSKHPTSLLMYGKKDVNDQNTRVDQVCTCQTGFGPFADPLSMTVREIAFVLHRLIPYHHSFINSSRRAAVSCWCASPSQSLIKDQQLVRNRSDKFRLDLHACFGH